MRTPGLRTIAGVAVMLAILSFVAYTSLSTPGKVDLPNTPTRFTVNGHAYAITYIATDQPSREVGLMHRMITNSTTMLFVFASPGTYSFWMGGVNSSLDIIWLSMTGYVGRVVYLASDLPPCGSSVGCPNYTPSSPASWVLEVKGGFSEAHGIVVGSQIAFS